MDDHIPLPLLLDGATVTNLFNMGMPMNTFPEEWILGNPKVLQDLQKAYVQAGSMAVTAPTFGANASVIAKHGKDYNVKELNCALVGLTRVAVGKDVLVAGNMSATGLIPEPFGDTPYSNILNVYRQQAQALHEAGVDFIICETLTTMSDARAAVIAAKETGLPVMVTMALGDSGETPHGLPFMPFVITMEALGADAVGINCFTDIELACELIETAAKYTNIPIVAQPAAGLPGFTVGPEKFAEHCERLLKAGAVIIGGCCGSTPEHIKQLSKIIGKTYSKTEPRDIIAVCSADEVFCLNDDDFMPSEEIICRYGMEEDILELEKQMVSAALVRIEQPEDAQILANFAYKTHLPIMIKSDNPEALSECLLLYQGRALVDRNCEIDEHQLESIARKYGALIY
ncbi:MAG TPA: hypothetical protein GXX17_04330 [Clostridiales bacterium]|nr:hypothetical protein [Clostridiales bacterium]